MIEGRTLPRFHTLPLDAGRRRRGRGCVAGCHCGLTRRTSRGFEVIAWADDMGIELDRWQRWLLVHGMELDVDRTHYRFRTVLVLVARQNGKTTVKALLSLWRLYQFAPNDMRGLLVGTAQDVSQAVEVMEEVIVSLILDRPALRARFNPESRDPKERTGIWSKQTYLRFIRLDSQWYGGRAIAPHGPRYLVKALNLQAGRGLGGVTEINIDELRTQRSFDGWAAISKVTMANPDAQTWCMSNAGDASSLLLNHLRGVALAGTDPQMFHAEWSAEDGCELDDPEAWAQANPSLGHGRLTEGAIRSALATDTPAVFRTEVLCQFVGSLNAAVDPFAWAACEDRAGSMDGLRARLALCVEVAQDGAHVSALVAAELPDDGRVRLEVVGSWDNTSAARRALPGLRNLIRPKTFGWFPAGPGAALSASMRRLKATPLTGTTVAEACMTLADYVKGRRILQPGDPLLDAHIARTSRIGSVKMWEFDRSGPEHVDAAFAAAGATYLAMNRKLATTGRGIILPSDAA